MPIFMKRDNSLSHKGRQAGYCLQNTVLVSDRIYNLWSRPRTHLDLSSDYAPYNFCGPGRHENYNCN